MPLTDEIVLAYASVPAGEADLETLQLTYAGWPEDLFLVRGVDEDISLPLVFGGTPVLHIATGMRITLPSHGPDGFSPFRLEIDNVANKIRPSLKSASQGTQPIKVVYRAYTTTDLTKPGDTITGLQLRQASLTPISATANVSYRQVEQEAFPLDVYDEALFPGLQNN